MSDHENPGARAALLAVWREAAERSRPLPSEPQLAARLGVSRPRVREELLRLEGEGLVMRSAGSGTYPNSAALHAGLRLNQSFEFAHMLAEAGYTPTTELLEAGWSDLDEHDADLLGASPGSSAYRTEKRWLADGQPVMIAIDVIPAHRRDLDTPPEASVFALVDSLRGVESEWENARMLARTPAARERELLATGEEPTAAVLTLEMVGTSRRGVRLYLSREVHRQGIVDYTLIRRVRREDRTGTR